MIRTYDRENNIIYEQSMEIIYKQNITEEEYHTLILSDPTIKVIQLGYETNVDYKKY